MQADLQTKYLLSNSINIRCTEILKFKNMKPKLFFIFAIIVVACGTKKQEIIDSISIVSTEDTNTRLCFNNTKLMVGNNISDRYLVYYNPNTIFLNVFQTGNWSKKIVHTGSNINSATLSFYKDTIWVCWKEGPFIKTRYTPDKGDSWGSILYISPPGHMAVAPSIYASSNGKIHFVWQNNSDNRIYHEYYHNGFSSPEPISDSTIQSSWPTVIAIGDTVLCAWKQTPLPTKVWFASSFDGGAHWTTPALTTSALNMSKDPNLAYAYNANTNTHYVYLTYDGGNPGQNKIYLQRSTDFGNTWSNPEIISKSGKISQFAHLESNNSGFVGVSYEQFPLDIPLHDDTQKDVGFVYSTEWANSGSFGLDSLAYTYNPYGSVSPSLNKIDENNFYLVWLTKDTDAHVTKVFERRVIF
jgi:hypothetical protein